MSLFAHLELESKVQIKDRTRFHGRRSFVSKGSTAITTMTIQPGADESPIDVFDADTDNRFLDWQFANFDVDIDATNNKIDFNEGGSELTATLTVATFLLPALATEIQTQLNAAGALTYTVTVSGDDKVTIAADADFSLLPETGTNNLTSTLPIINIGPKPGFGDFDFANITTVTGKRVRHMPKEITIVIGDGSTTETLIERIEVCSVAGDALFASDTDLRVHRHDILDWLPEDRNSFLHVHRRAQELMIEFLNRAGYVDLDGDPLEIAAFTDASEAKDWAIFLTLRIIHDELSNDPDDDFFAKARDFEHLEERHRDRAILRVDTDGDGRADIGEGVQITGGVVLRR